MKARVVRIGNSQGIRIPKVLLAQTGSRGQVELIAQVDTLIIRPASRPREGWSAAFKEMARRDDDALLDDDPPSLSLARTAINCAMELQLKQSTPSQWPQLSGANMSLSLVEALAQTDLEAGRTYRCEVKGQLVELRVLGPAVVRSVSAYDESDVMLDPWVELPQPIPMFSVTGEFAPTALPDVPEIPDDGDGA